jgi:hypothetical protein
MFNKGGQIPSVQYAISGAQIAKLSRGLKPGQLGRYLDENNLRGGLTPEQHQQVLDFDASVSQSSMAASRSSSKRNTTDQFLRDNPNLVNSLNITRREWRGLARHRDDGHPFAESLRGEIRPYSSNDIKNKLNDFFMQDPNTFKTKFSEWIQSTPMRGGDYELAKEIEKYLMPQYKNKGGPIFESQSKIVPGVGSTDTVPAMLTPGEFVINKQSTRENLPLLHAINNGQVLNRNKGGQIPGTQYLMAGSPVKPKAPSKPQSEEVIDWAVSEGDPLWNLSPSAQSLLLKSTRPKSPRKDAALKFLGDKGIDVSDMFVSDRAERWKPRSKTAQNILDTQYEINLEEGLPLITESLRRGATDEEQLASILATQQWSMNSPEEIDQIIKGMPFDDIYQLMVSLRNLPENHQLRSLMDALFPKIAKAMPHVQVYDDPDVQKSALVLMSMLNKGGMIPQSQYFALGGITERLAQRASQSKRLSQQEQEMHLEDIYARSSIADAEEYIIPTFKLKGQDQEHVFAGLESSLIPDPENPSMNMQSIKRENFNNLQIEDGRKIQIVPATPQGLLEEAIRLRPEDIKLQTMLSNIKGKNFNDDEVHLLDSIIASMSMDAGGKPLINLETGGLALVLASLTGNKKATAMIDNKLQSLYSNVKKEKQQNIEKSQSYLTDKDVPANWDDLAMVHSTSRSVEKNKDGSVMLDPTGYHQLGDSIESAPRSTIHFTTNGEVTGGFVGAAEWGDTNGLIVTSGRSMVNENNNPTALNSIDTFWSVSPGERLTLPKASIVRPPYTDELQYSSELIKRGLLKSGETPLPITEDVANNEVLYFIKKSEEYTDDDRFAIFESLGRYISKGEESKTLRDLALQKAMRQQGVDRTTINMGSHNSSDSQHDLSVMALANKEGIFSGLHSNSQPARLEQSLNRVPVRSQKQDVDNEMSGENLDAYRWIMAHGHIQTEGSTATRRRNNSMSWNTGGTIPGVGNTDKVPAMLTPGEFVINKQATQSNLSLLHAINDGNTPQSMQGFNKGGQIDGVQYFAEGDEVQSSKRYSDTKTWEQRIRQYEIEHGVDSEKVKQLKRQIAEAQYASEKTGTTGPERSHFSPTTPGEKKNFEMKNGQFPWAPNAGAENNFINDLENRGTQTAAAEQKRTAIAEAMAQQTEVSSEEQKKIMQKLEKGQRLTYKESVIMSESLKTLQTTPDILERSIQDSKQRNAFLDRIAKVIPVIEARTEFRTQMTTNPSIIDDYYQRFLDRPKGGVKVEGQQPPLPSTKENNQKERARVAAERASFRQEAANEVDREKIRQEEESKKDQRYKKALSARLAGTPAGATNPDRRAAEITADKQTEDAIKRRIEKETEEGITRKVQNQTEKNKKLQEGYRRIEESVVNRKAKEYEKSGMTPEEARAKAIEERKTSQSQVPVEETAPERTPKKAGLFRGGVDAQGNKIPARMTSGVHQASMGLGGGLMMASMAPMMMADQETGKFMGMDPNMAMMGAMGAGTVVSMLPMLQGAAPIVAGFLAVITAAGVGLKIWRDKVDGAAVEAAKLGANMGGTANAMEGMANILGVADPAKSRQFTQLGVKPKEAEEFAKYSEMLKGEAGGKFIKEMQSLTSDQRFTKLSDYLKNAIASGMLNKDQAQLFAKAVGATLQDQILSVRAGASIATQQKGTSAVLKIAQQRENIVLENKGIQNVLKAKPGQELDTMDASMTISAGMQIIKSFSETIAQAEKEYRDGTIKFKEFNDTVITANTSINKWSDAVSVARTQVSQDSLGGFFGEGSMGQAAQTAMDLAGVGETERKGIEDSYNKMYDLVQTENAGSQEKGFLEFWGQIVSGKGLDRRYDTKDGEVTVANEGAFKQLETKAQEAGFGGGVEGVQRWASETDPKVIKEAFAAANNYAKDLAFAVENDALKITMQNLVAAGQDASSVASQANAIFNDPVALKAFNDAGRTVEAFATALEVANSTMLFSSNDFRQKFQDISAKFFTPEYKNAFNAYVSSATTESDRQARVSQIEGVGVGSGNAERQMKMDFLDINTTASQYFNPQTVQSLLDYTQKGGLFNDTTRVSRSYGSYGMGVKPPQAMVDEYDNRRLKEFNKTIEGAGKAGLSDKIVKYAIDISTKDGKDPNQVLKNLTENFINLQSLPEEIRLSLNIDINDGKDINKFGGDAEAVARGWGMLSALNPNIDLQMAASAVLLDGNGNIIEDTTVIAKNIMKLNKAYETLGKAKGTKGKRKAQIEIAEMYVDEEGKNKINGKEVVANAQKTLDEIGKDLDKLPNTKVNKIIQIQADLQVLNLEKNAQIDALALQYQKTTDPKDRAAIRRQIEKLQGEISSSEEDAAAKIKTTAIGPDGGEGGGGGGNPLLDFKKSLLEQIRLYADLSMTLKKLFSSKMSFLKLLGSNKGVDDQLRAAGLGEAATQAVMSMGADAAKKWIKANVSGGKLKESGKKQEEALLAGAMSQRQSEAVGAIKTANMQQQASTLLASGKYGKAGIETTSAILADPLQSEGFVKAAKEYDIVQKRVNQAKRSGKSLPSELEKEWKSAQKTLLAYTGTQDEAFSKTNIQDQLRTAQEAAAQQGIMMSVKKSLSASGTSREVMDAISSDYGKSKALYELDEAIAKGKDAKGKGAKALQEAGRQAAKDKAKLLADTQASLPDTTLEKNIADLQMAQQEINRPLQKQIDLYQEQINLINKEIEALQRLNDSDQNRIRTLTREKEMLERQVEVINRKNEKDQLSINSLQREDELRTRVADALNHELSIMSEKETKIREAYDKRIKALDEVAKINDYIINQQKNQLGLAQALSQGDVYAAAAAQQTMQTGTTQFATEQMRTGLQTGMENQIEGLTTSGGLTRVQAEDQIRAIGEQTYQTSLLVRDLQDAIYGRNLEIAAIKLQQRDIDDSILVVQDDIYKRETEIIEIQRDRIQPLQDQITKIQETKDLQDKNIQNQIDSYQLQIDQRDMADEQAQRVKGLAAQWGSVGEAIAEANRLAKDATATNYRFKPVDLLPGATDAEKAAQKQKMDDWKKKNEAIEADRVSTIAALKANGVAANAVFSAPVAAAVASRNPLITGGGMINLATGGVVGQGGRDSVHSMLTPGEFVMRKASVQKYGAAMFERMNMGAFDMPRYNTQQPDATVVQTTSNTSNINAPVYNTYSVNVSANTNASADDIANTVMTKIKRVDSMAVRSFRGY